MKHCKIFLVSLVLFFCCCSVFAQNAEMEDSLNNLIDELYELGDKQNPEEIDYIPTFEIDSIAEVVIEDNYDKDDGTDPSMGRLWVSSISHWFRENSRIFIGILCLSSPILLTILGLYFKKRGKRFVGMMLMSSFLGMLLECCCLIAFLIPVGELNGLFLLLSLVYGPFLWLVCGLYVYGVAATIYIYKRSGRRLRVFVLLAGLLCGFILPPSFVIPIVYFISKRYLRIDDGNQPLLYRLIPYYCGSLIGWFALFLPFWLWIGIM